MFCFVYLMCMDISPASRLVPQVCARCPLKPEESIRYLELESQMTMSYRVGASYGKTVNASTAELSLQPDSSLDAMQ